MSQKSSSKNHAKPRKEGKEAWLIGPLLFRLYGLLTSGRYRAYIRDKVLRYEGGGHFLIRSGEYSPFIIKWT